MTRKCMYCGVDPAAGYACITKAGAEQWYCHEDGETTCYERAQVANAVENLYKLDGGVSWKTIT